jgi:O-antigen/teichoic acid export membrane protein/ubiquinone/menaquinone biosynthesis C-methylase UbiE
MSVKSSEPSFATDHLIADLGRRSVRGAAVTFSVQATRFLLGLGSTMALARLLTPADFGLVAMVTAVTGFVAMFKDAGLSMATVQRSEVTHSQVSTLFWVNVGLSAILMLLVAALAMPIARFYGEPALTLVTVAIAGTFVLGGLTVQHVALLKRQMRFGAMAIKDIGALAAGIIVAIVLAARGAGYWALVAMIAVQAATEMVLAWLLSAWRPGPARRGTGVRPMLAFGGFLSGTHFLVYIRRNLDNVLIGALWGGSALGLYSKAYALLMVPITQVSGPIKAVVVPALSRLCDDAERYRAFHYNAAFLVGLVTVPAVGFVFVSARDLVAVVLGHQWHEAVPIFLALAPAGLVAALKDTAGWTFVSTGRTDRAFRAEIVGSLLVVMGIILGLRWGPVGVAAGFSAAYVIYLPGLIAYSYSGTPLRMMSLLRIVWPIFLAMMLAGGIVIWFRTLPFGASLPSGGRLGITFLMFAAAYLLTLGLLDRTTRGLHVPLSLLLRPHRAMIHFTGTGNPRRGLMKPEDLASRYTGATAAGYEALRAGNKKWRREQDVVEEFLGGLPAGARILDIPVGTGRFIPVYEQRGFDATGMDISRDMLAEAKRKIGSGPGTVAIRNSDIFQIDAPDESFDCVVSIRFMNWIDSDRLARAMTEIRRVTRRHVIVGIRHFVPLDELAPFGPRFLRQLKRRIAPPGGLTAHRRETVTALFESLELVVLESRRIESAPDGTDYHIYHLVRRES